MEGTGLEHRITVTTTLVYVGDDPHEVAHRLVESFKGFVRKHVVLGIDRNSATVTAVVDAPTTTAPVLGAVVAIGPHQINPLDDPFVTVRFPPDATTVLSVAPNGTVETRPEGTQGAYERAIRKVDRVIYAPTGPNGAVYIFPFVEQIPNA